jgi:hypothetical protein
VGTDAADGNPLTTRIPTAAWKAQNAFHSSHKARRRFHHRIHSFREAAVHLKHAFFWSEGWPAALQGVAPDGIRTAKETQHQPNSTTEKGDILNELSMGTFSKSFDNSNLCY